MEINRTSIDVDAAALRGLGTRSMCALVYAILSLIRPVNQKNLTEGRATARWLPTPPRVLSWPVPLAHCPPPGSADSEFSLLSIIIMIQSTGKSTSYSDEPE